MNSRTSLPRSPISPMTMTSASAPRASMDMMVDLPTPEPAKTPRRWPRAQGVKTSMAFTPSAIFWSTRARDCALGATARTGRGAQPGGERALCIEWFGERIDDAAEPAIAGTNHIEAGDEMNGRARAEAIELVAGEDDGALAGKTDEFAARAVFVTETNGCAEAQGLERT